MPKRVFIVEDSPALRQRICDDVALMKGLKVVGSAETQDEAIAAIARLRPDIVITDLNLRAGTGLEVLRRTADGGCSSRPHIVVLTNFAYPEYKRHCLNSGAHAFFDKSSEYGEFLRSLGNLS
ncbi:MAG: response regulator transcription factor [Casimicrobiaceae bacterium]